MRAGALRLLDTSSTFPEAIEPQACSIPPYQPFPKTCACGLSYSEAEWHRLPFLGTTTDSICTMEFRNCACHSTIIVLTTIFDAAEAYELYRTDGNR